MRIYIKAVSAAAVVLVAGAGVASAQHIINLSTGGADQIYTGADGARAGSSLDQGPVGGGDERRDLIVGAPGGSMGRVYIMFGGPTRTTAPLDTAAEVVITGPASFGAATAVGTVTAVSTRDLIVGAPNAVGGRGAVYLFPGSFTAGQRIAHTAASIVITGAEGDRLGSALATADLDNDGYRELIIGAPGTDRVYVVYGGPSLASADVTVAAGAVIVGHPANNAAIGNALLAAPLTGGDSIYDFVIGEPAANTVYLLRGDSGARLPARIDLPAGGVLTALPTGVTAMFVGPDPGDEAGTILRAADLDGNGQPELLIGAPGGDGRTNGASNAGEVYVVWNELTGTSARLGDAGVVFYGGQANQRLGGMFAAGDINRDTPNDLAFRLNYGDGGEVRVYYGRSRSTMGSLVGGVRIVDFAIPNQENRIIINDATSSLLTSLFIFEVTGEGARDIVIADAAASSGAGQVFLTISPKMRPSSSSVALTVKEGQVGATSVGVLNESAISVNWSAAPRSPVTWLSVAGGTGMSNAATTGTFQVNADAAGLEPGVYAATVDVSSTSPDLTMTRAVAVNLTVQTSRYAAVDSPGTGTTIEVPFTVAGWAIDTAAPTGTGVSRVDVYAVSLSGGIRSLLGTATYGEARPEVGSVYGSRFTNSGFSLSVERAPAGTFRIVAEAYSTERPAIWSKGTPPTVTIEGLPAQVDINGDGLTDLVWQNTSNGALAFWSMEGLNMKAGGALAGGSVPAGRWEVRAIADFNADGQSDLALQEMNTGELTAWLLNGSALSQARPFSDRLSDPNWHVVAAADMNADGQPDLVFQHVTLGYVAAWLMNGTTLVQATLLNPGRVTDLNWKVIGAGDLNGDSQPDLIWQNERTRVLTSWLMDGTTMVAGGPFSVSGPSDTNWQARAVADIDGDGKVDLLWQHATLGYVAAWLLDGRTFLDAKLLNPSQVSAGWQLAGPR